MYSGRYSQKPPVLPHIAINRLIVFGGLIMLALVAFEVFNYSTTEFALKDLLGGLRFAGLPWATILAIAFCGIDFAGLARMFTPEVGAEEPREVWYLFGAWMLAAIMNAMLTWWGVSIAISNHEALGNGIVARKTLLQGVPIFVAIMVWLIRVLIIGTFATAGDRLFTNQVRASEPARKNSTHSWQSTAQAQSARSLANRPVNYGRQSSFKNSASIARPAMPQRAVNLPLNATYNPAPRTPPNLPPEPEPEPEPDRAYEPAYRQTDPVYVPVGMSGRSRGEKTTARR